MGPHKRYSKGRWRTHTDLENDEVLRHWRIRKAEVKLAMRRNMCQRWAARPEEHRAELAAVLGASRMEEAFGICRNRKPWNNAESTPWAIQMEEDLRRLVECDEAAASMMEMGRSAHSALRTQKP